MLYILYQFLNNDYFVLLVDIVSFVLKIAFFLQLFVKTLIEQRKALPLLFLLITLFSGAFIDFEWICTLLNRINFSIIAEKYTIFLCRLGWMFFIMQYQTMILLLSSLINQDHKKVIRENNFFICFSFIFSLFFIIFSIIAFDLVNTEDRPSIEFFMYHACSIYLLLILMPISLWRTYSNLRTKKLPILIRKQCYTLLSYLVIPYLLSDLVNMNPIRTNYFAFFIVENQAFTGISTLILTYLLYFCTRRILNIRFLDLKLHVQSTLVDPMFNTYFKETLCRLGAVNYTGEIPFIVERFLHKALHVEEKKMQLFIRIQHKEDLLFAQMRAEKKEPAAHPTMQIFEEAVNKHGQQLLNYFKKEQIVLYDELDFVNFYNQDPFCNEVLALLHSANCSILVPVFQANDLVAYIVIYEHARKELLYSQADKDALIVFANYLGTIITTIQNKKLEKLTEQNRFLVKAVYYKNQYINHLKESVRTFLHPYQAKKIAIFTFRRNAFWPINGQSEDILPINLNTDQGNSITKQCKNIAQLALEERTIQTTMFATEQGEHLVATAVPHSEHKHVSLIITPPSISDLFAGQLCQLQLMEDWDFALYLHTTKTGALLNNLLPGSTKRLTQCKIDILKTILSKKTVAIDCVADDIAMVVNLIHQANGRKTLFTLDPVTDSDYEEHLFGLNSFYSKGEEPLLSSLHLGTLFIKNIHKLSISVQEKLATYIEYGYFSRLKTTITSSSDVQILIATPLYNIEESKMFCSEFSTILKENAITIPSLATLDEKDMSELIEGYSKQAIKGYNIHTVFMLSENEKKRLITNRPDSLIELKQKIAHFITNKNKPSPTNDALKVDPAFLLADDTLIQAARLGKNALKEKHILTLLWYKFEKNQNKIATFLGVNRSSVGRRIKDFSLE